MDKNKFNLNLGKKHRDRQRQLYLDIAFFGVFACVALIFLLLAFDKMLKNYDIPPRRWKSAQDVYNWWPGETPQKQIEGQTDFFDE